MYLINQFVGLIKRVLNFLNFTNNLDRNNYVVLDFLESKNCRWTQCVFVDFQMPFLQNHFNFVFCLTDMSQAERKAALEDHIT